MAKPNEANKAEVKKDKAYYNELVTVNLFKDNGKYKDDVFVAVNGVGMIVPRGKEVKIPRKYALALEQSIKQDQFAATRSQELVKQAEDAEKNI